MATEYRLEKGIHYFAVFSGGPYGMQVKGKLPRSVYTVDAGDIALSGLNFNAMISPDLARKLYKELLQKGFTPKGAAPKPVEKECPHCYGDGVVYAGIGPREYNCGECSGQGYIKVI